MKHIRVVIAGVLLVAVGGLWLVSAAPPGQVAPTASPAVINSGDLALQQPQQPNIGAATATWTPSPPPPAVAQVTDQVNVRAEPSTDAAILGVIRPGEAYNITGRWFEWVQIQFVSSPNGRGWVFGQLVTIVGDEAAIPNIDLNAQPTLDPTIVGATLTLEIVTRTPGGLLTATAQNREISLAGEGAESLVGAGTPLPTFTYPPGLVFAPTQAVSETELTPRETTPRPDETGGIPPIVPIALLGGLGLLGLVVGTLRRGNN
jgi:uncharacterized protein YraI